MALTMAWGLLSILTCVLVIVAFVQPQWIGDTETSPGYGHLGVFQNCYPDSLTGMYTCSGSVASFSTILNNGMKAATVFVGLACIAMMLTVLLLLLFACFKRGNLYFVGGILEAVACVFLFLGCIIYPSGWKQLEVQTICGSDSTEYNLGDCGMRWAYILAIVGIFDAGLLAVLAFFLGSRRPTYELYTATTGTVSRSEFNGYGGESVSRKSTNIQPMLVTVPADGSEFGTGPSIRRSTGGPGNYQL